MLDEIGDRIVASIASQIEMAERNRAILKAPELAGRLGGPSPRPVAHVPIQREDNEQARHFFEMAVRLDPAFARPYAGLSFTHFQNAFLGWGDRASRRSSAPTRRRRKA